MPFDTAPASVSSMGFPPDPTHAAYFDESIYRFTIAQYHDLIERGTLTADDPVELLEGVLVFKLPKNKPHIAAVRRLRQAIAPALPTGFF